MNFRMSLKFIPLHFSMLFAFAALLAVPFVANAGCAEDFKPDGQCFYDNGKCPPDRIPVGGKEQCNNIEGGACCIKKAEGSKPTCLGLCIKQDQCDPATITAPAGANGKNTACGDGTPDGFACCGAQKKETAAPTGVACCGPKADCKTKINPGIVCPKAGDVCCMPDSTPGATSISTENKTCAYGFPCPLGTDIPALMGNIVRYILGFVGALFLAMFIWGGVLYITAGDSKRAEEGQKTLVNAVIGVAIVVASYTIINWVLDFVGKVAQ